MTEMRRAYKILLGKSKRRKVLDGHRCIWQKNVKIDSKTKM
jgi:hypothetical protein